MTDPRELYAIYLHDGDWLHAENGDAVLVFCSRKIAYEVAREKGGDVVLLLFNCPPENFLGLGGRRMWIYALLVDPADKAQAETALACVANLKPTICKGPRGVALVFPYVEEEREEMVRNTYTALKRR